MSATMALVGGAILLKAALISVLIARRRRNRSEDKAREEQRQLVHLARVAVVGELSGALAHELNQPLTAILSNAQAAQQVLVRDRVDVAELRGILDDIVAADKRAEGIITRLRRLLKREELTLRPIGLAPLLDEVFLLVRSNLTTHCVCLDTHVTDDLPDVLGDAVQIQQVLLNLLLNACDALSEAAPEDRRIELDVAREPDGRFVHIRVRDHGPGIESDGLERVFDAFFTTKPNGLGLGLAICRQIVTAHGGRLWATQNGGRGAAFHMTLPIFKG
jgi:two-component system sensor kinase FixL